MLSGIIIGAFMILAVIEFAKSAEENNKES